MSTTDTKIHGFNSIQIGAIFEALVAGPNHPNYSQAVRMAGEFDTLERERRAEEGRRSMQAQIGMMDDGELATFHALCD